MRKIFFVLFMMVTPMVMISQTRAATSVEKNNAGIVTKAYFSAQDMTHIQENAGLLSWNELTESLKEQETIIKIWNTLTGVAVYQETMTGESKLINISSWPSGIYAINVSCGEQSISKKVTKR